MVMGRQICSVTEYSYLSLSDDISPASKLLAFFTLPLFRRHCFLLGDILLTKRKVNYGGKWGWFGGGF